MNNCLHGPSWQLQMSSDIVLFAMESLPTVKAELKMSRYLFIVLLFVWPTRGQQIGSDLEIADRMDGAVPFQHYLLDIYELKSAGLCSQRRRFAYMPIVQLDHASVASQYNKVTRRSEFIFRINLWSPQLQQRVFHYLKGKYSDVTDRDVTVFPFKSLMLSTTQSSPTFQLSNQWRPYRRDQFVTFDAFCADLDTCNLLADEMKANPRQFSHLQIHFCLPADKTVTKPIEVSLESITSGQLFTKISRQFLEDEMILMVKEDVETLVSESVSNSVIELGHSIQIDPNSAIYVHLRRMLVHSTESSKEMNQTLWKSVYWPSGKYRPDQLCDMINKMYNLSDASSRQIIDKYFESTTPLVELESSDTTFRFGFRMNQTNETSSAETERSEMLDILKQSAAHVEWNGVEFEPKRVDFFAVNLAKLRDGNQFRNIQTFVTYSPVSLSINVAIDEDFYKTASRSNALDVKVEAIESQLKNISSLLNVVIKRQCPNDIGERTICYDKTAPSLSCYCFVKVLRNWSDSDHFCRSKGMHLVSVETEEENDVLRTLSDAMQTTLPKNLPNYWTSGSLDATTGRWMWSASHRLISDGYSNWAKGRPRGRAESLLLYFDDTDGWYDQPRAWTRYSICEN